MDFSDTWGIVWSSWAGGDHSSDGFDQQAVTEGFRQDSLCTESAEKLQIKCGKSRIDSGYSQNANLIIDGPQRLERFQTVHVGHDNIQNHRDGGVLFVGEYRFLATAHCFDWVASAGQRLCYMTAYRCAVVYDEDVFHLEAVRSTDAVDVEARILDSLEESQ